MSNIEISYLDLCEWLWAEKDFKKDNLNILINKIQEQYNLQTEVLETLKQDLKKNFLFTYNKFRKETPRLRESFKEHHTKFINKIFIFNTSSVNPSNVNSVEKCNEKSGRKGRPRLSDENVQGKSRRRRINEIRSSYDEDLLVDVAMPTLNKKLKLDESIEVESEINMDDDKTCDASLAMFMDVQLSKEKYLTLREYNSKMSGNQIYPPYDKILQVKKRCYPPNIDISQSGACVDLQSLLNHTSDRIFLSIDEEFINKCNEADVTLYVKWGMDGCSGQQTIKQKFEKDPAKKNNIANLLESEESAISEESVFMVSLVPLLMKSNEEVFWENEKPGSVRFCRPVRFEFKKETAQNTKQLYKYYKKKIQELITHNIIVFGKSFRIFYSMECTMLDGKVCNVLTEQPI